MMELSWKNKIARALGKTIVSGNMAPWQALIMARL
jgi:hypothetical protein